MGRKHTHGLMLVGFMLVAALLPATTTASPPDSCLAYAFLESDDHRFLIGDNLTGYGDQIEVIHDCQRVAVFLDGEFHSEGESGLKANIEPGNYTIELRTENGSWSYSNFQVRPDRFDWDFNFSLVYEDGPGKMIPETEAKVMQNWAAGATGLIVWVLCVYVYWNLINSYTQRNFVEEVQG